MAKWVVIVTLAALPALLVLGWALCRASRDYRSRLPMDGGE